jgi:hypothetical protein
MRGIEIHVGNRGVRFAPPLQGGKNMILDFYLGLRAERFTPGYHIAGFQPFPL